MFISSRVLKRLACGLRIGVVLAAKECAEFAHKCVPFSGSQVSQHARDGKTKANAGLARRGRPSGWPHSRLVRQHVRYDFRRGGYGYGVVFELTSTGSERVLHSFSGGADGTNANSGVIRDPTGKLFGATSESSSPGGCGGYGCGVAFALTP